MNHREYIRTIASVCVIASISSCTDSSSTGAMDTGAGVSDTDAGVSDSDAGVSDAGIGPNDWKAVLMKQHPSAAYSLSFFEGDAKPGLFLRGAAFFTSESSACEQFTKNIVNHDPRDFWAFRWTVSGTEAGDYSIVQNIPFPAPSAMSEARLERWSGGLEVERHTARLGSVTLLSSATTPDRWADAPMLVVRADVQFPTDNVQSHGCGAVITMNAQHPQCECEDANGKTFTCEQKIEPGNNMEPADCCQTQSSNLYRVTMELDGAPCGALCQSNVFSAPSCDLLQDASK